MPATLPSSSTMIWSACKMVEMRWATMMTVASAVFSRQRPAQDHVGLVVQRGEAVVKEIYLGLLGNGPGDGQPLLLPAGDVGASLGDGDCA